MRCIEEGGWEVDVCEAGSLWRCVDMHGDLCAAWEWVGSERGRIKAVKIVCDEWGKYTWWTLSEWILGV